MIYLNKKTRVLYKKIGDNEYQNLDTMISGEIKKELADKIFEELDVSFEKIINKNPVLKGLIKILKYDC